MTVDEVTARFEGLTALLSVIKSFFSMIFDESLFPTTQYPETSLATFTQIAHAIIVLFRLSTYESPGFRWNRQKVVQELDFGDVACCWAKKWRSVPINCGFVTKILGSGAGNTIQAAEWEKAGEDEDSWTHAGRVFELLGSCWKRRVLPKLFPDMDAGKDREGTVPSMNEDVNMSGINASNQHFDLPAADFSDGFLNMELPDDRWLNELFREGGQEFFLNH
jgi:hypothetical protein